jgi:maltose O-acetyltransferase
VQPLRTVLANLLVASPVWSPRTRARLLARLGARAERARVVGWFRLLGDVRDLELRPGCYVNAGLTVGAGARVVVEERVHVGPGCSLLPTTHELGGSAQRAGATRAEPVVLGAGSWLGAGVTVLGGVRVAPGCVVGAGSLVVESTEPDALYVGSPARLVKRYGSSEG